MDSLRANAPSYPPLFVEEVARSLADDRPPLVRLKNLLDHVTLGTPHDCPGAMILIVDLQTDGPAVQICHEVLARGNRHRIMALPLDGAVISDLREVWETLDRSLCAARSASCETYVSCLMGTDWFRASTFNRQHLRSIGAADVWRATCRLNSTELFGMLLPRKEGSEEFPPLLRKQFLSFAEIVAPAYSYRSWELNRSIAHAAEAHRLSEPQVAVLCGVVKGMTNREIALTIERSVHTVNPHVRRLLSVFEVASRADLAKEVRDTHVYHPQQSNERLAELAIRPCRTGRFAAGVPAWERRLRAAMSFAIGAHGTIRNRVLSVLEFARYQLMSDAPALGMSCVRISPRTGRYEPGPVVCAARKGVSIQPVLALRDSSFRGLIEKAIDQVLIHAASIGDGISSAKLTERMRRAGVPPNDLSRDFLDPIGFSDIWSSAVLLRSGWVLSLWTPVLPNESIPSRDNKRLIEGLLRLLAPAFGTLSPLVAASEPNATLSPAQSRVFDLAVQGLSEKQIAVQIHRSPHTVHSHLRAIYRHYGVANRAELLTTLTGGDGPG